MEKKVLILDDLKYRAIMELINFAFDKGQNIMGSQFRIIGSTVISATDAEVIAYANSLTAATNAN